MPRKKPAIGKREQKRLCRQNIRRELESRGLVCNDLTAGSINYTVARYPQEENQIVAAIYGSIKGCASIWLKEAAFKQVMHQLPSDTIVEDVALFRRGFQWAVHFDHQDSPLIQHCVDAAMTAGNARLTKTMQRRADDERRAATRAEREAKMAERKRDWQQLDDIDAPDL